MKIRGGCWAVSVSGSSWILGAQGPPAFVTSAPSPPAEPLASAPVVPADQSLAVRSEEGSRKPEKPTQRGGGRTCVNWSSTPTSPHPPVRHVAIVTRTSRLMAGHVFRVHSGIAGDLLLRSYSGTRLAGQHPPPSCQAPGRGSRAADEPHAGFASVCMEAVSVSCSRALTEAIQSRPCCGGGAGGQRAS